MSRPDQGSTFRALLSESIIGGLEALGEGMSTVILYHVCQTKGLREEEIPDHPGLFVGALGEVFGEGSVVIENLILKALKEKVEVPVVPQGNWSLVQFIELCRREGEEEGEPLGAFQ